MEAPLVPEERVMAEEYAELRKKFVQEGLQRASDLFVDKDFSAGNTHILKVVNPSYATAKGLAEKLASFQLRIGKEEFDKSSANFAAARNLSIGFIVGGVALGLLLAWWIIRSITGPLNQMRATITEVEKKGDFTQRISVSTEDEVGQTAKAFNELMAALQQTLGQVLDSVGKVSDAAQSLSAASGQVAASSSSQSEATSSMAAAVEQMTVSINHVSDSAHEAVDISRKSGTLSTEGGEVIHKAAAEMSQIAETVRHTAQAIEELGQHSNQISSIVQVIKDVADQTNLLALNAAIEAARAGEQGRGFAVVADEVRKLAERTTKATEEITQMIGAMQHSAQAAVSTMGSAVDQVSGGVALANQAGSAIVQIKDGAEQVVGVVNDISSALAEQSSASNDIASQVEKVAQMTEENSAAAAETASAANNLQILADTMQAAVSRFKI
jgi:methyl-accepting chemotaxis protein